MQKTILIENLLQESRIAILEDNALAEIYYERHKDKNPVGNIYKGKVIKVLPGMESAFIDIGLPKAAFLYINDIRSDNIGDDIEDISETEKDQIKPKQNIQDLIKTNQDIMVQVSKAPIGNKGARVTCNLSIPGRNLVIMPYISNVAVSRQINSENERNRLKDILLKYRTNDAGFIIRTVAQKKKEVEIKRDVEYLLSIWDDINNKFQNEPGPQVLYEEANLTFRLLRDGLSDDTKEVIIENRNEYEKVKSYSKRFLPQFVNKIKISDKKIGLFDHYGVSDEIDKLLSNKVPLKSGGYLVIDQSEALTAIDVNTGSFTGSTSHEATILQTNLEAVSEIVKQIRLRDIGGIIILDFIDMSMGEHRNKVYTKLKAELRKDKTKSRILAISEIGLVEMTRKRSKDNLNSYLNMSCPYCNGSGRIRSIETISNEIFREIIRTFKAEEVTDNLALIVHPDIADYLKTEEMSTFQYIEKEYKKTVHVYIEHRMHIEQYEILEAKQPAETNSN